MARVSHPPAWEDLLSDRPQRFVEVMRDPGIAAQLRRAADSAKGYLHWTKFRHLTGLPEEITTEEAWGIVAFLRVSNARELPFTTATGSSIKVNVTDPLRAALHRITGHRPLLQAGLPNRPDADVLEGMASYRLKALIDEAYYSAVIEGAVSARRDAHRMVKEGREPRTQSEWMILNNYRVGKQMSRWVEQPLTPELIREVQEVVTQGTLEDPADSGRLRTTDDIFVMDNQTSEVVHVPPPHTQLEERLERLCRFANEDEDDEAFLHPLVKATLIHYQLAYDHPFADGNGRTARWIALWFLLRLPEFWWFAMLSISRMTSHDRAAYYDAFRFAATDGFDATYLVRHQVAAIEKEMGHFARFLQSRQDLLLAARRELRIEDGLNVRQLALFDSALRHGSGAEFTQIGHKRFHAVSHKTARADLEELVGLGLLDRHEGRPIRYRPTARLLSLRTSGHAGA